MSITAPRRDPWERWIKYVDGLPWADGKTKNDQTYKAFLRAGSLGIPPQAAYDEVSRRVIGSGGKLVQRDLQRNLDRALSHAKAQAVGDIVMPSVVCKPTYSPAALTRLAYAGPELTWEEVAARSPIDPAGVTAAAFLDAVFRPGEHVIIVQHRTDPGRAYEVGSGKEWVNGLKSKEGIFFLSNPTDGKVKKNADGNFSLRSESNLIDFRHLVVESDKADDLLWLRAMAQVPLPAVAIYSSGGRSIHLLLRCDAKDKIQFLEALDEIKPGLVRHGADQAAMTAVRLTRLPTAWRSDREQKLLFLDPAGDPTPLNDRKRRVL